MDLPASLLRTCETYAHHLQRMERVGDPDPQAMEFNEALRVQLHNAVLDEMEHAGIRFRDRDEASRMAWEIVNAEL